MEIYERIEIIREEFFNNNIEFAKSMGEKPTTTSGWCAGKRNIGINVVQKILEKMPNINDVWLYTGKGSMLLSDSDNIIENKSNSEEQKKQADRNSVDKIINQKIENAVMERLNETIDTILKNMKDILKDQNQSNSNNFKILIDAIVGIAKEEDRDNVVAKVVELKKRIG